jgi:hypothetical protein
LLDQHPLPKPPRETGDDTIIRRSDDFDQEALTQFIEDTRYAFVSDRMIAMDIRTQINHLAKLLTIKGVAGPQLRAANFLAPIWRKHMHRSQERWLFKSGDALLEWLLRTLA